LLFLASGISAQPMLLIGKADAEISGAFSYDFLKSPLDRPLGSGKAQMGLNLPINVSARAQKLLGSFADSQVVIPDLFARVSQSLNAHVDVSAPLWGGAVFFAARENASLTVSGALGDARFNMDTSLSDQGAVLLKGSIHMPLIFDMSWRSLTFGYVFSPVPHVELAVQLHKHVFTASTSGDLRPDLTGRIEVTGDANTTFDVVYPDSKVYGTARGSYQGETWSPEMGLGLGPLKLVSRMGARMTARGYVDVDYSVPFFIDPETFETRFTEPDSFLAPENLSRLLDSEVGRKRLHIRDRLVLTLPQSHTITWEILPGRLALSYTKVLGHVSIHALQDTADAEADSLLVNTDGFVDLDLFPDQVICLSADFKWIRGSIGAHTLNMGYRKKKNIFSGLSPLEWDGDPFVPILNFGVAWGSPLVFSIDLYISPLPAVRSGVAYGF
jgi:hypothetical protein